ncbi:hypothetical protein LMG22037_06615 [Paraburkholderia phenoliruptrix]|uniref:Uncharacterized protein n=1 Tax=Paraburkholderia phenoliruptrix TaxID=252970 RepID=A0A6J5CPQ4_9BURK|nr:hypothetical protein LMG22037_06615 [Paraburkholderia phenoliruptrix]
MPLKPRKAGYGVAQLAKPIGQRLHLRGVLGAFVLDLLARDPCCSFSNCGSVEQ